MKLVVMKASQGTKEELKDAELSTVQEVEVGL